MNILDWIWEKFYESVFYDAFICLTGKAPQWDDAEKCGRYFCCKCGGRYLKDKE